MKITGSCHCGAITYEAEVDPATLSLCHCTDCQRLTGTAYRAAIPAPAASFVLHGEPTSYLKTAESGAKRRHAFCPTCGAPIFATAMENPITYTLRFGTINERDQLARPRIQLWHRSAAAWSDDLHDIPAVEKQN
ncbi:MAG: GFA family protein [Pseudomonadota bacterium]